MFEQTAAIIKWPFARDYIWKILHIEKSKKNNYKNSKKRKVCVHKKSDIYGLSVIVKNKTS